MSFLDPILSWTLLFHPLIGVFILSLIVTLIINIIYKYATNQVEMKRLKESIDGYKKKIKESKDNPKKMMKLNQEAMGVNMQYMKHSLRATLFTFIPIIFIFAWMNAQYTYAPLAPGEPLVVHAQFLEGFDGNATLVSQTLTTKTLISAVQQTDAGPAATFAISGDKGKHDFVITYQKFSYNGSVWFGENPKQQLYPGKGPVQTISVDYPRVRPLGSFHLGSWYPGWLSIYIVLSIILSMGTRKLMKIY